MSKINHYPQKRVARTPHAERERASERDQAGPSIRDRLYDRLRWLCFMKQLNSESEKTRVRECERANVKPIYRGLFRDCIFDYSVFRWNRWLKKNNPGYICYRSYSGCLVFDVKEN